MYGTPTTTLFSRSLSFMIYLFNRYWHRKVQYRGTCSFVPFPTSLPCLPYLPYLARAKQISSPQQPIAPSPFFPSLPPSHIFLPASIHREPFCVLPEQNLTRASRDLPPPKEEVISKAIQTFLSIRFILYFSVFSRLTFL